MALRSVRSRSAIRFLTVAFAEMAFLASVGRVNGADEADTQGGGQPARPSILFNRWQEDWSVLSDPEVPREPGDALKYIPLSADDPKTYLSLGAELRERFEANDATNFGVGSNRNQDYIISRAEVDADLRIASQIQLFAQVQSDNAFDKQVLTPVDQDRSDLEQAFVALTEPLDGGMLKVRLGRQEFGFDLQRFVSVRDGPNVRQAYDAAWFDYEHGLCRYIAFYSHPVQYRDLRPFDDDSNNRLAYGGFRVERKIFESARVAAYFSRFTQAGARFPSIRGNERRDILDVHFSGTRGPLDWDVEAMNQTGQIATESIEAWAFGSIEGYTWAEALWKPRLGLQIDAASGDKKPNDHQLDTFNPLFPNGYYFTLAAYTTYANLIHFSPSLTIHPLPRLNVKTAVGLQWRETTQDAVYTLPLIPVSGTAGHPGFYTGTYSQLRLDYQATSHVAVALELVHFALGATVRQAGGYDSDYFGAEVKFGW